MVNPTGGVLAPATGVTAPELGTETTALGRETPALWPSPGYPWGTPAAGQAQTPGPPPRRGGSGVVKQDRNSTGQGVGKEMPSTAPGSVTSQWTASRAPGTTPSSPLGTTKGLLDTTGWLSRNSTTEPSFWPTPTEGPTDHIEWQASLPTWNTPPALLDRTGPEHLDPGPSSSPDLPSAPTPESLKLPACGECLGWRVLGDVCPEAPAHRGTVESRLAKPHTVTESKTFEKSQVHCSLYGWARQGTA